MQVKDYSFRNLYHAVCYIEDNETIKRLRLERYFPGHEFINGILAYGYINPENGFHFEILGLAYKDANDAITVHEGNDEVTVKLGIGSVEDCQLVLLPELNIQPYINKLYMVNNAYEADEELAKTRGVTALDQLRHHHYPDDVQVLLVQANAEPEICWVRLLRKAEDGFYGVLLNEPEQNFGVHEEDTIYFTMMEQAETALCVAAL